MPFSMRSSILMCNRCRSFYPISLRSTVPTFHSFSATSLRSFTTTSLSRNWLAPKRGHSDKNRKGRPRVPVGGSMRGTTVVWGDYGLRLTGHHRRISSAQLQLAADTIKRRLKAERYRLYTRVCANVGVYVSGNEMRMGKGKGKFDHWAARIAVSQIMFEVKGDCHEQVIRDALRLAGNKLPGTYEFVKRGDPPVMGITKMTEGLTLKEAKRPRAKMPADVTPERLPSSTPDFRPDLTSMPTDPMSSASV